MDFVPYGRALVLTLGALGPLVACVGDPPAATVSDSGAADAGGSAGRDATLGDVATAPDGAPDTTPDAASEAAATDAGDAGDAARGSDADAAATWSPSNLGASLVLWLDASRSVAVDLPNFVASWGDVSGTGNPATASGTARPVRTPQALNGHDVVTFNGTSTYLTLADSLSLRWGLGDFAIVMVARYSNTPGGLNPNSVGLLWAKFDSSGGAPFPGVRLAGNTLSAGLLEGSVNRTTGNVVDSVKTYNDNAPM